MLYLRKSAAGALAWAFTFWYIQCPGRAFVFRGLEPTSKHEVRQIATQEEFEDVLCESGDALVCVDFTATWCSPCQQIAPAFEQLSQELGDVVFVKVDVDENEETAQKYDVFQMPTFLFIRKGEVVDQFSGANAVVLRQKIELLEASKDEDTNDNHDHEQTKGRHEASGSDLGAGSVDSPNDPDSS